MLFSYSRTISLLTILISVITLEGCSYFPSSSMTTIFNNEDPNSQNTSPSVANNDSIFEEDVSKKPMISPHKPATLTPKNFHSKAHQEKIEAQLKEKNLIDKDETQDITKAPISPILTCNQPNFLTQKSISAIYTMYAKNNKVCQEIDHPQTVQHFVNMLAKNYSSQDIRLINADKTFMSLFATAIKNSDAAEKVILNKQMAKFGCHLLKPRPCALMKKSLY